MRDMNEELLRELRESSDNAYALLLDRMTYGMSFVDENGKRVDPRTMEPWCSMDLPDAKAVA